MPVQFNAGEVFEIAQQIERNGERFYRTAADSFGRETRGMLLNLAEMEQAHRRVFASMEEELSEGEKQEPFYDPYREADQYLRALAGGQVFDLRADPTEWLGEGRGEADVLHKAVDVEKDSILFYLGLKQNVPEKLGKERIDEIIQQEMNHMTLLASRLRFVEK
ncbi:MAG: ferritin-like domain-containing protein [Planctomycetota bacterium]